MNGLLGALTVLFAAAKVFGFLDWSWWWVFSPVWIGVPAIVLPVLLIALWAEWKR